MRSCEQYIMQNKLLSRGEKIGVGCSGGSDSVALLHYLAENRERFGIEVVAIHVNHQIRPESDKDCKFVEKLAKELGVRFCKFKLDIPKLAAEKGQSLETAAREARYEVFRTLVKKGVVNKVALAHHKSDQAETILMHIFRGSGVAGAKGMEAISENIFIRPMLDCSKEEIKNYIKRKKLDFVTDSTNFDNSYNRNFVRNVILKEITERWPNAVDAIVNFGRSAAEDDDYINSQVFEDAVLHEKKAVKIPLNYFVYHKAIVTRIIFKALKSIGVNKDIERRHIFLIINLAKEGENGSKLSLPFDIKATKEYDYIVFCNKGNEKEELSRSFRCGSFQVENFGKVKIRKIKDNTEIGFSNCDGKLLIDGDKLPKNVTWRFRKEGDVFAKFGGGSKKLKSFMIDKKIPLRLRDTLPVLADEKEVYVIAGEEISNKIKLDEKSKNVYEISIERQN